MLGQRNWFTRKKLMSEGVAASATVLAIADRGTTVTSGNGNLVSDTEVVLKTRLRVEPTGEPAFEIHQRFRYPQMSIPSVGSVLQVRYDPADPDKIMIDPSLPAVPAGMGAMGIDLNGLLSTIHAQKAAGADRATMGDALRAQVGETGQVIDLRGATGAASPENARLAQLERLSALHVQGALTDAEFAAQKAVVLGAAG